MSELFQSVCDTLERLPLYNSTNELKFIVNEQKFYGISRYDALKTPENRNKLISALRDNGQKGNNMPIFHQIKHKAKEFYDSTGWKYVEELLEQQRDKGGKFYSVLITFENLPLYDKKSQAKRLKAIKNLVNDNPAYWKVERMDSLGVITHAHILMLIPNDYTYPDTVNGYTVSYHATYNHRSDYQNVRDFMRYLLKPADARALKGRNKGRYYKEMYYEWFQNELNKQTGKGKVWESVTLRGALNLDIRWLKGLNRAELEARYEDSILPLSTPQQPTKYPAPHTKKPHTPTHSLLSFKAPLGGRAIALGGVLNPLTNGITYFISSDIPP